LHHSFVNGIQKLIKGRLLFLHKAGRIENQKNLEDIILKFTCFINTI